MSKREYRRFTAEQKIEILREAEQPGVTVSEVCRRHGLSRPYCIGGGRSLKAAQQWR
jgi:transposase-like protein